jgi:8-oxo-dGTP diphosphatase
VTSREYPDRPWVAVGVVVWRDDRVLLVRRGKPPRQGLWGLPGGGQELGETVYEAAAREVREETGLTVEPLVVLTVADSITRDDVERIRFHYTLIEIEAEWRAGEPVAGDDAADAAWFPFAEIERLDLWSETERIIRMSAERRLSQAVTA